MNVIAWWTTVTRFELLALRDRRRGVNAPAGGAALVIVSTRLPVLAMSNVLVTDCPIGTVPKAACSG